MMMMQRRRIREVMLFHKWKHCRFFFAVLLLAIIITAEGRRSFAASDVSRSYRHLGADDRRRYPQIRFPLTFLSRISVRDIELSQRQIRRREKVASLHLLSEPILHDESGYDDDSTATTMTRQSRQPRRGGTHSARSITLLRMSIPDKVPGGALYDPDDDYDPTMEDLEDDDFDEKDPKKDTLATTSSQNDLFQKMEQQQAQINQLMQMLTDATSATTATSSAPDASTETTNTSPSLGVVPVKAMLFIDGTWLYYSIYEREPRRDPILQRHGFGWQQHHRIDWAALPAILCESLQDPGWGTGSKRRPMEIVRVNVFTSYKPDTLTTSWRYRMFEEMKAANFDVTQAFTVGKSEKTVDIQLAVDMLHYATVPDAYDVALILTGDKDFMPAMMRTRQKGRKVALVSIKSGCNKALYETEGIKDYEVTWLEDHLDKWVVPYDETARTPMPLENNGGAYAATAKVTIFTLAKVVYDFIGHSGLEKVSSRDIGRYLQYVRIGENDTLLQHVKLNFSGLKQMLHHAELFDIDEAKVPGVGNHNSYWVILKPPNEAKAKLLEMARSTNLSQNEKEFFNEYSTEQLSDRRTAYCHTLEVLPGAEQKLFNGERRDPVQSSNRVDMELPDDLSKDYSKCTVLQLKERCRDRGLKVTGKKAELLGRVQRDVEEAILKLADERSSSTTTTTIMDDKVTRHLKELVIEYVKARAGIANSRDVGKYLQANKSSKGDDNESALQELKLVYGSLARFLKLHSDTFGKADLPESSSSGSKFAFGVTLRTK